MHSDITKHERLVEKKNNNISDVTAVDDKHLQAQLLVDKKFNSENYFLAVGYPFFEYTIVSQLRVAR